MGFEICLTGFFSPIILSALKLVYVCSHLLTTMRAICVKVKSHNFDVKKHLDVLDRNIMYTHVNVVQGIIQSHLLKVLTAALSHSNSLVR